jgi:hypothetical protein
MERLLRVGDIQNGQCQRTTYHVELDVSQVLEPELASRYQQLIGILRWAVELGQVDIVVEVSTISSHLCQPRMGHLEGLITNLRIWTIMWKQTWHLMTRCQ